MQGVDGTDVSALLQDPTKDVKDVAYHQYPACGVSPPIAFNTTRLGCNNVPANKFTDMAYSLRTREWRYTCWFSWDGEKLQPKWDGAYSAVLYNHTGDDGTAIDQSSFESVNLASVLPDVAARLHAQLLAFFKKH